MSTRIDTLKEEIKTLTHRAEFLAGWVQHIEENGTSYEEKDKAYKIKREIEGVNHLISSKEKEIKTLERITEEAEIIKKELPQAVEELSKVKMVDKSHKAMLKGMKERMAGGYVSHAELINDYKQAQILTKAYNILQAVK